MVDRVALLWNNVVDSGTVSASGFVALAPASNLQTKHVHNKWRVNATSAWILLDAGSLISADTLAVVGMSGSSPTLQVRASTADSTGAAGDAFNSGSLVGAWDSNYLPFVRLMTLSTPARYFRVDISEAAVPYIEAGRLVVGSRAQFSLNFQPGWGRTWVDPEIKVVGRSGLTFDDLRDKYRTLEFTMDFISETERWSIMEAIDLALGTHGDILVITDPTSSNLSRDSVWGYIEQSDAVVEPISLTDRVFRRNYRIRERL